MPLPDSVAQLIDNFGKNRADYRKGHYNETQTRVDYVNPLFAALGWDMDNAAGLSELHREVVHEDKIKISGRTKAPDYSFRTGGGRKFFLETKKPAVSLDLEQSPAYQIRRYGWTAKLPLSILTNFEEFAVYDTRIAPEHKDSAKIARIEYFKYSDYAGRWDELSARFSQNAVLSGAFDKYADAARAKRIAVPVDKAFLAEISGWREKLARNIVKNNPGLGPRELNYAVQMIIDRIIFLRISEDRGAEPDFLLQPLTNKGGPVYPRLLDIFHRADARYNSGLFHFDPDPKREAPDNVTPHLSVDDRTLKEIIASVYYPESPFEFSVFPADILGQVYEQFLGKVIRISGTTAEVEEKPEVKKAGGVYYTPTYIVDYIVRNTVGKLVEGKTPAQVAKLSVLDPACGSGSFLIGAYQFLLDWHQKYYLDTGKEKWAKGKAATIYLLRKTDDGSEVWRLTTAEKKRILLNNIYGVDIDTQAVEVSKLSLLLKVLEGESAELIDNSLKLFKERALPDLEHNIKCGNSLIGPDFYDGKDMALFDLDAQLKINTFDWKKAFPQVMSGGGFDAVIGNPPYRMLQPHNTVQSELEYLRVNYVAAEFKIDLFHLFLQKSVNLLNHVGLLGFIIPTSLLNNVYAQNLRSWITERCCIESISVALDKVFATADVHTSVFIYRRELDAEKRDNHKIAVTTELNPSFVPVAQSFSLTRQRRFDDMAGKVWNVLLNEENASLISRLLNDFASLKEIGTINRGLITGDRKEYIAEEKKSPKFVPILSGSDVHRYSTDDHTEYVLFERPASAGGCWDPEVHLADHKMVVRQIGKRPTASVISEPIAVTGNIFTLRADAITEKYLLGIINSKLTAFFWQIMFADFKSSFPQVTVFSLGQLPIRTIDFDKPAEKAQHDKMVGLVERMLTLHKDKAAARLATEKNMIQQQIEQADAQIDKLVYALYGLTENEIAVVEGTAG